MPLIDSPKKSALVKNARELEKTGRPRDQSWAIAYQKQREARAKLAAASRKDKG